MAIIRGTTPTVKVGFKQVNIDQLREAELTIRQQGANKIVRQLSDAALDGEANALKWTLTQQETLGLAEHHNVTICCVWVTLSGVRGESKPLTCEVLPTSKNEVM